MRKGVFSIVIGLLLIAAALCLTGYNLWDTWRAGQSAEDALKKLSAMIDETADPASSSQTMEYPDYVLNPDMDMPVKTVDGNRYIGILKIPAIGKEFPILSEWSYDNLKIAPCRYSGSAYLNNMVLCGHNYRTHFGPIENLRIGDSLSFTDVDGNVFKYNVVEVEILRPTAVEEMTCADDWDLSLFTCTLSGRTRIVVRCEKSDQDMGKQP